MEREKADCEMKRFVRIVSHKVIITIIVCACTHKCVHVCVSMCWWGFWPLSDYQYGKRENIGPLPAVHSSLYLLPSFPHISVMCRSLLCLCVCVCVCVIIFCSTIICRTWTFQATFILGNGWFYYTVELISDCGLYFVLLRFSLSWPLLLFNPLRPLIFRIYFASLFKKCNKLDMP